MKKTSRKSRPETEMRAEYDFRGGVRGKYAKHFADGDAVVVVFKAMRTRAKPARSTRKA